MWFVNLPGSTPTATSSPAKSVSPGAAAAVVVAALALTAFLACTFLNRVVLGGMPHGYDDVAYHLQGRIFAEGRVTAPGTPVPECFWLGNVVVEESRIFCKYPPGWPALLGVAMAAGWPAAANAFMAAVCLLASAWAARLLFGPAEAVAAAVLAVLSPFFLFMGANFLSHMSCAAVVAVALGCSIMAARSTGTALAAWALAAGAAAGAAALIRPFSGLLGCLGVALVVMAAVRPPLGRVLSMGAMVLVPVAAAILIFLAYNAATTGSPWIVGYKYYVSNFSFLGEEGPHRESIWQNFAVVFPRILGALRTEIWMWPLPDYSLAVLAIAAAWRCGTRWALAGATALFVVAHSFYYFFDSYFGPRLIFETMPFLIVLSAAAAVSIIRLAHHWKPAAGPAAAAFMLLVGGALAGRATADRIAYYAVNYCGQGPDLIREVEAKGLTDALVFLRVRDGFHYGNVAILNKVDLAASPVVFAHYVEDSIAKASAAYPRRETWILDAEYRGIIGPDDYPDRFTLLGVRWTRVDPPPGEISVDLPVGGFLVAGSRPLTATADPRSP